MDLLKQLEIKLQSLLSQRNQLREELERVKTEQGGRDAEFQQLRRQIEGLLSENAAMLKEREEVQKTIESILKQIEALS